jgi:hypothetical protein
MLLTDKKFKALLLVCVVIMLGQQLFAQIPYQKKTAQLMTVWGENLQATDPILPEYPRPQMVRDNWLNLNGIWQFQQAASFTEALPSGNLTNEILVPFPVASPLSGIMEHYENVWYRRSFTVPTGWEGQRILLHFGAVDYRCEIFINGTSVGTHEGGYDPFSIDITEYLTGSGAQDLAVRVNDPTDAKGYPRGKQTLYPGGIMYTETTGIWQTVWLEAVPQTYLGSFHIIPDIDNSKISVFSVSAGTHIRGLKTSLKIFDNGVEIASAEPTAISTLTPQTLDVPQPVKLWSPDSPHLYDMKIYLVNGTTAIDSVSTYFGMRKISKEIIGNYNKMLLNNEFLFQMGPLDQGFWPDGTYTAPTDEALRFDIEKMKELGFNMVRKHIKVEPQRWYYWCDKLGLLVWQDMPSMNSYINTAEHPVPEQQRTAFKNELEAMIKTHWNSPCIISWVVFNEFQGSHDEGTMCNFVKGLDATRLVNINSGGDQRYDNINTDIRDYHSYPAPTCPLPNSNNSQVLVCGEYGGIGYFETGHIWSPGNPYETVSTYAQLLDKYTQYADVLIDFKCNSGLSAAVYTEITDVEMELNGFLTYDRKVLKGDIDDFYAVNQSIIHENRFYDVIIPTSERTAQTWKYTTVQPASNWMGITFDDSSWSTGAGGFGTDGTPGAVIGTEWSSGNIWIRRTFTMPSEPLGSDRKLLLRLHHDEDCQVYINGVQAVSLIGYTGNYLYYDVSSGARASLVYGGQNTIAIHCRQTAGGQYIDAGIYALHIDLSSLESIKKKEKLVIYPNPVKELLTVENEKLQMGNDKYHIEIFDPAGRIVQFPEFSVANCQMKINVASLPKGIYLLRLKSADFQHIQRFIKI